eukprot:SAG22_NODE_11262_length_493_cov_0.817259_1_plen_131_part_10
MWPLRARRLAFGLASILSRCIFVFRVLDNKGSLFSLPLHNMPVYRARAFRIHDRGSGVVTPATAIRCIGYVRGHGRTFFLLSGCAPSAPCVWLSRAHGPPCHGPCRSNMMSLRRTGIATAIVQPPSGLYYL